MDDLPARHREEGNDLHLDRVASRLLGVDYMDIGDGRTVDDDVFDRRSTAAQRLFQRARVIDEAVIVQALAIDDLDIARREKAPQVFGVLSRVEQAGEGVFDQGARLVL
jgi:hypothetical protein